MSVPTKCEVLVVGGGPAGSYAAAALAREGIDTVVLEADKFPRYHVGESMLPSIRHFLRFIDLDETFDKHGFRVKNGATFKLNKARDASYTDFLAAGGSNGYAWNVKRSEADELFFKHAAKSGAKTFDGVKVDSLDFLSPVTNKVENVFDTSNPGQPVSAAWSRKADGSSGKINFEYLVDASGRYGLMSCKYLKNRKYNQGLKNIANWGYWKNTGTYGVGRREEGCPYFEHISDASGWVWFIPLHDGTTSVGVVMNQHVATEKKKAMTSPSTKELYLQTLKKEVPGVADLLAGAELADEKIHAASDWSYSASEYASPNVRLAGDAACFIDPFFSSGVHLALSSGLSAATTICASRKGQCDEETAMKWHSTKVQEGYTRFLLVVLSALKQIRQGDDNVLGDWDEAGFDRAFSHFRPIIQGTSDVGARLTQNEVSKTVEFCTLAFMPTAPKEQEAVLKKLDDLKISPSVASEAQTKANEDLKEALSPDEMRVLSTIRAREMLRSEDTVNIDTFSTDTIDGLTANLVTGSLGLMEPAAQAEIEANKQSIDVLGQLMGEKAIFEKQAPVAVTELSATDIKNEEIPVQAA